MPRLVIYLLGRFDVQHDGQPVRGFETDKVRALLAYLAIESGYAHRRDMLASLFWPEQSEVAAHTNLRGALSNLRQALGESSPSGSTPVQSNHLHINRDTVQFNAGSDVWIDSTAFESVCKSKFLGTEIDAFQTAVAFYRGNFLEGLTCRDCPEFDDWAYFVRERLQHTASTTLFRIADFYERSGEFGQAIEYARRRVEVEPWQEEAYCHLMRLLAMNGERSAAIAQYEICRRRLLEELGVEPANATRILYESIREGKLNIKSGSELELLPAPGISPFKGMHFFGEADADIFFGREELTARLLAHLRDMASDPASGQCMAVVGASGSGKSSLVRAGLAAAVKRGGLAANNRTSNVETNEWTVQIITPTANPLAALKGVEEAERRWFLVIVDQFEEFFTLCKSETERQEFIRRLLRMKGLVVLTLRADFYTHCAAYPALRQILCDNQEYIGEMNADELRHAITEPARQNGWELDPGLEDLILRDTGASSKRPPEPGALPLLEHALLETWIRRSGRRLTLKGYTESGGVRGAIAQTADRIYANLDETQRSACRRIFLRLTELGEGTQDTRRRVAIDELASSTVDREAVGDLLKILSDARLVTLSEGNAEVAHEALIHEWPALCTWLNEDREGLRLHRRLTESAQAWLIQGRDEGELYRGMRLIQTVEWAQQSDHPSELNSLELEFLSASQSLAELEESEREARIKKELDATLKILAVEQQRGKEMQKNFARELAAQAELKLSSDPELCLLLALQSVSIWQSGGEPVPWELQQLLHDVIANTRLLLAITDMPEQSWALDYNPGVNQVAVFNGVDTVRLCEPITWQIQREIKNVTAGIAFSPDGKFLASGTLNQTVVLWNTHTGEAHLTLRGFEKNVWSVDYSKTGNLLATGDDNAIASVWDLRPWREAGYPAGASLDRPALSIKGFRFTPWFDLIKISPDEQMLATTTEESTAILWDLITGRELHVLSGHTGTIYGLAFNPECTLLATASTDYSVRLWDLATGIEVLRLTGHSLDAERVAFNPDGSMLASSANDGLIILWDPKSGRRLFDLSAQMPVHDLVFSPDGRSLISTHEDNAIRVWGVSRDGRGELASVPIENVLSGGRWSYDRSCFAVFGRYAAIQVYTSATLQPLATIPVPMPANAGRLWIHEIALSADGTRIAFAYQSLVSIWDIPSMKNLCEIPQTQPVTALAFSPDGKQLAAGGLSQWVDVWNIEFLSSINSPDEEFHQRLPVVMYSINTLAFSPDGSMLAASGCETDHNNGLVYLWNMRGGLEAILKPRIFQGDTITTMYLTFSPDGNLLATGGFDQHVEVWDVKSGSRLLLLIGHNSRISTIDFSPDGMYILTISNDRTARVWDRVTGKELLCYHLPGTGVCAFFSPDGQRLVLVPEIGGMRLNFFLNVEDLVELAQSRLTRDWKPEERAKYLHESD